MPNNIIIRPTVLQDALWLNPRLIDYVEATVTGKPFTVALLDSITESERCWTAVRENKDGSFDIIAIFGVAKASVPGMGCPWLIASEIIYEIKKVFLRESRRYLAEMSRGYDTLENMVHADNTAAINWLGWLGFEFGDSFNFNGQPFIHFYMNTKNHNV